MDKTRILLLEHHADRAGLAPRGRLAASPAPAIFSADGHGPLTMGRGMCLGIYQNGIS